MKKGNKIRLIFWGIIWVIALGAAILGYISYIGGKGVLGSVQKELKPIVETFNNLNGLEKYKAADITIEAKVKKTNIVVSYITIGSTASFTFEYKEVASEKVLYMKYNTADTTTARQVVEFMLDAVSIVNGHKEGDLFEKYTYDDFLKTSAAQGVAIQNNGNDTVVYINIAKSILDYKESTETPTSSVIEETDLTDMKGTLTSESKQFNTSKGSIILYVLNQDTKYVIYAQDINNAYGDNLYKSLCNVIKVLVSEDEYNRFTKNYPSISSSKTFGKYVITINATPQEISSFDSNDNIVKVEITL